MTVDLASTSSSHVEADAFFDTLETTPPHAVSACLGWTAHEVIAHLISGAEGLANQIEAYFDGRQIPAFGTWEERELPLQALADSALRLRLITADARMASGFDALLDRDPNAVVPDIGFGFPVFELLNHMRQEYAIHRWDLIGDDPVGHNLLSQPDLLSHSVRMLAEPLLAIGMQRDCSPSTPMSVRVRCSGEPDLVVEVDEGRATLRLDESDPTDSRVIDTDPAARLLLLWGRRPADSRRVRSGLDPQVLRRLQTILCGF